MDTVYLHGMLKDQPFRVAGDSRPSFRASIWQRG